MRRLKKLLAEGCILTMLMMMPGMTVLADEMGKDTIVDESCAELSGEEELKDSTSELALEPYVKKESRETVFDDGADEQAVSAVEDSEKCFAEGKPVDGKQAEETIGDDIEEIVNDDLDKNIVGAGTPVSQTTFDARLSELRSKYPNYSTWTDYYAGGHQCWGFARLVADY